MAEYRPDVWVIVRIAFDDETVYKVLGGWYGGFAGANSWRLNSGITKIEADGDWYAIYGTTGSVYHVHKNMQRTSLLTASIYSQIADEARAEGGDAEIVDVASVALDA